MEDPDLSPADKLMLEWSDVFAESTRGLVVCCLAMIDDEMCQLIKTKMARADEHVEVIESIFDAKRGGSLQSLHAKRQLAFAMGWIEPDIYYDIGVLADIRNRFAHDRLPPSFDDPALHKLVRKLRFNRIVYEESDLADLSRRDYFFAIGHFGSDLLFDTRGEPFAKTLFLSAVHNIICQIMPADQEPTDN